MVGRWCPVALLSIAAVDPRPTDCSERRPELARSRSRALPCHRLWLAVGGAAVVFHVDHHTWPLVQTGWKSSPSVAVHLGLGTRLLEFLTASHAEPQASLPNLIPFVAYNVQVPGSPLWAMSVPSHAFRERPLCARSAFRHRRFFDHTRHTRPDQFWLNLISRTGL